MCSSDWLSTLAIHDASKGSRGSGHHFYGGMTVYLPHITAGLDLDKIDDPVKLKLNKEDYLPHQTLQYKAALPTFSVLLPR